MVDLAQIVFFKLPILSYFYGKYQVPLVVLAFVRRFFSIPIQTIPPFVAPLFFLQGIMV